MFKSNQKHICFTFVDQSLAFGYEFNQSNHKLIDQCTKRSGFPDFPYYIWVSTYIEHFSKTKLKFIYLFLS